MSERRIVITGMGAVTPIGNTVADTWKSIRAGECGIDRITLFDTTDYTVKIAAEVKNFNAGDYGIDRKEARKMCRFTQFAAAVAAQAIADAGYTKETISAEKSGIMLGNGIGGFETLEAGYKKYFEAGNTRIPPLSVPMFITNEGAANVSMLFGIDGPSWTLATACSSGTDALGAALDLVRSGRIDVCVAGGTEAAITGFGIGCFTVLQTLATSFNDDPKKASRPFDVKREGFTMGEGAGILILEELEHAKKRGAKIYAEFAGYGASSDAYHITSPRPDGTGGALAIKRAIADAGIKPEDVDYYNAHGTSTPINDPAETQMVKLAFGDHAYKMKVSSTKSMTGHCVGAAGAIEAIIGIKAINDGFYPPTINLENPDLEHGCDLDYVPNTGVEGEINCIASASLGFGGHNGCLIMKKYKDK
ncbi:beta-ketoacyl-ACP synthase II [Treponema brennaborense]|uniref:3-oxoacyl-[acyl-carrier-protein] synthase 2 n=1 Tax=Treponema brennaborense (strain DSM 12168 / CIP 105900 / DD5/3) TaxID=906968 RepID=F4LKL2_TREBD|nr:beta-ketoacyl-ACP synthase II [Treponema brennaborense]AEE17568.1 3-oxoacyl-(acyl-carrier-protein) synthase 2 [Treponema brennaborense DSM 12168]